MGSGDYLSVTVHGTLMAAARSDGVVLSTDSGLTWMPMAIPTMLTRIHRVAFSPDGTLWLGAREGRLLHPRSGQDLAMDRAAAVPRCGRSVLRRALWTRSWSVRGPATRSTPSTPRRMTWKWWQTGYRIGLVRAAGDRMVAASLYDGVLLEPQAAGGVETGQK